MNDFGMNTDEEKPGIGPPAADFINHIPALDLSQKGSNKKQGQQQEQEDNKKQKTVDTINGLQDLFKHGVQALITGTAVIFIQVDAGNQFERRLTIGHHYANMLIILAGITFNGISGTGFISRVRFLLVDPAL